MKIDGFISYGSESLKTRALIFFATLTTSICCHLLLMAFFCLSFQILIHFIFHPIMPLMLLL